jgi:hypothetical protein
MKIALVVVLGILALSSSLYAGKSPAAKEVGATPVMHTTDPETMRAEGEQRFRANCGRCHAAPQKFLLRHMRVRATITDQDMRLVLFYMTQ